MFQGYRAIGDDCKLYPVTQRRKLQDAPRPCSATGSAFMPKLVNGEWCWCTIIRVVTLKMLKVWRPWSGDQVESVLGALETELLNGQPEVNKIAALRWEKINILLPLFVELCALYGLPTVAVSSFDLVVVIWWNCCSPMAIIRANNVIGSQINRTLWTCDHDKWTVCSSLWASSVEFDFSPVCVLKCLLKCLKCLLTPSRVRGLFPGREPFWAGYGNKAWDILAYKVEQQTIYLCPSCFGFCRQSGSTQTGSSMCSRIARFLKIHPSIL